MKTTFQLLIALFLATSLGAQIPTNLDFESGREASGAPVGWKTARLLQKQTLVLTPGEAGQCLYLQAPFTEYGSGYACQDIPISGSIITMYRIAGKIRTKSVVGGGAQLYAYGKQAGETIGYVQSMSLQGDNDWTQVSLTLIVDSRMDSIRIGCYLGGEGEAWFDDLTFSEVIPEKKRMSRTARKYLKELFRTVEPIMLDREEKPWAELKNAAKKIAAGAQTTADVYPAMRYTLGRLNKHSFMFEPAIAEGFSGNDLAENEVNPDLIYCTGKRINEQIAYLSMPGMGSGHQATLNAFADSLQGVIATLDTEETTGWVLDLRANGGGNCWPMLAGAGPLLGEGVAGYFQERDGSNASPWIYQNGKSFEHDQERVTTRNYQLRKAPSRVAVLIGPQTASSGEIMAVAFLGLPYARHFGEPTGGYSTTNSSIQMSDGAMVMVTVSVYGDRNKQAVDERVMPDVEVSPNDSEDAALSAALRWIAEGK